MTIYAQDILKLAVSQEGKAYVYGSLGPYTDPADPKSFDCSGLVWWCCHRLGTFPAMPEGAINQYLFCNAQHTLILIDDAKRIPGALLFRISESLGDHVVISLGKNDLDVEARGAAWGVGSWSEDTRVWTAAAKIPGVVYNNGLGFEQGAINLKS